MHGSTLTIGLSSSKTKTKTSQKTTETGSTTPTNPPFVTDAIQGFTAKIDAFGNKNPRQFVAPASPLQKMAWKNVGSLDDWQAQARLASQQALGAGQRSATSLGPAQTYNPATGQASTYQSPQLGSAASANAVGYNAPHLGNAVTGQTAGYNAVTGQASTYDPTQLGDASLVGAHGYSAPDLGNAQGYAAFRIGAPIGAQGQSYTAQSAGQTGIDPTVNGAASDANAASLLDNFSAYQNPYQNQVIDATLADYDQNAGQLRAQQAAQAAKSGAFGGSRYGIREAQTEGELARGRASTQAGLLDQGFRTAAGLSQSDAANRQQASLFNAQNQTGVSLANAAAENARRLTQAGMNQQTGLFNADAANQASRFGAESGERASLFNSGQDQARLLAQAGMDTDAARYGADTSNQFALERAGMGERAGQFNANLGAQADLANQASQNQFALTNAGFANDAARTNAAAQNQFGLSNLAAQNQAGQYNAAAQNQFGLANMDARNQFALQQAGLDASAGQFNAGNQQQANLANAASQNQFGLADFAARDSAARYGADASNQFSLANMDAQNQAGQYNTGAQNQFALANAGFQESQADRQLQGAGLLGDLSSQYGAGVRDDLGTMAQLGDQQRGIDSQYALSPVAQLQTQGQLYAQQPYNLFNGQNIQSTGTMNGTNTTSSTPSLFNQMLAAGQVASMFVKPSVRRAKTNIEQIGTLESGLNLYRYRYLWDDPDRPLRTGVMADEVAVIAPEALGPIKDGYRTVDYGRLGLAHLVEA